MGSPAPSTLCSLHPLLVVPAVKLRDKKWVLIAGSPKAFRCLYSCRLHHADGRRRSFLPGLTVIQCYTVLRRKKSPTGLLTPAARPDKTPVFPRRMTSAFSPFFPTEARDKLFSLGKMLYYESEKLELDRHTFVARARLPARGLPPLPPGLADLLGLMKGH